MTFESILFPAGYGPAPEGSAAVPDFFGDLNLDQIVARVTAGKEEYRLEPFFYESLHDLDAVVFRQEIMRDLEGSALLEALQSFAESMRNVRQDLALADKLHYSLQQQRWFLEAVNTYCEAVGRLLQDLSAADICARGLLALRRYLAEYVESSRFSSLREQASKLITQLARIRYNVFIDGLRVEVFNHEGEPDYSAEVENTFERFKQGAVKEYTFKSSNGAEMDYVESQILGLVAQFHPEVFTAIERFCAENRTFQDHTIVTFDREIQFYIAYSEHCARLQHAGLKFCYPRSVDDSKELYAYQAFDLALAGKLIKENASVVSNDFHLSGPERMIVVSGPNQGGKTTFARMLGQLHYLASLGLPVPGVRAQLFLFDNLFTHFEREESVNNLQGKLEDDLTRLHKIIERATPDSIVILNEIFTSTTVRDAVVLSKEIAARLLDLDLLCVWVTFLDELASLSEQTVSMMSTVVPDNPAERTYKIVRRPPDGLAYALAIAEKHRVTYSMIKERIGV
jgi:DNA mismatch repair protein MutS